MAAAFGTDSVSVILKKLSMKDEAGLSKSRMFMFSACIAKTAKSRWNMKKTLVIELTNRIGFCTMHEESPFCFCSDKRILKEILFYV
jgi:hypothetical protein